MPRINRAQIRKIAEEACLENPDTITPEELEKRLIEMAPDNWLGIDRSGLLSRLNGLLDGADVRLLSPAGAPL